MNQEKVTEDLVRQNGNQAAVVMADYAGQGGESANSPLTAQHVVGGGELRVGDKTFPVRQERVADGSSETIVDTIGQSDWDEVVAIFTSTPVLCVSKSGSTYQSALASIYVGGTGLENYIKLGSVYVYKSEQA